jgi:hypothetical protein
MAILLFSFTSKIMAQDANNDGFHDGDVAALKKILTDNPDCTIKWSGTNYGSWSGVSWNDDTPKTVKSLTLRNKKLKQIDLKSLTEITIIDFTGNSLTEIYLEQNKKLFAAMINFNKLNSIDISKNGGLRDLRVYSNNITSIKIPRFMLHLDCQRNRLKFTDLLTLAKPNTFKYSDQASITANYAIFPNEEIDLSDQEDIGGTKSVYKWYKDGVLLSGVTSSKYTPSEIGVYKCKITNSKFPSLTLSSGKITVKLRNDHAPLITSSTFNILENSTINSEVGTVTITDNDPVQNPVTFSITDNTGSFKIDENTGVIKVKSEILNHEIAESVDVTVSVNDGDNIVNKDITIYIDDVNEKPENLQLSAKQIAENEAVGTEIGLLSATDIDENDVVTITLDGDNEDNDQFEVKENKLLSKAVFNKEVKDSYKVKVKATDKKGLFITKIFTVTVTNVNEKPENLQLSAKQIAENEAVGTEIGLLSATDIDENDAVTISLDGDNEDNDQFEIKENKLLSKAVFNKEVKDSYRVKVKATDKGGLSVSGTYTITVTNVNEKPENLQLSAKQIAENEAVGTEIGLLSATDIDENDVVTITLDGDNEDNDQFEIKENKLLSKAVFNKEVKDSYKVKVKATDKGGLSVSETYTITVTNVNEKPENLQLSAKEIAENEAVGTEIGLLSATDIDENDAVTITLDGDNEDNDQFEVKDNKLLSKAVFNKEVKDSYKVKVKATDKGGLSVSETYTITVTNVNEKPENLQLSAKQIAENEAVGTEIGLLSATDIDENDVVTITIDGDNEDNDQFEIKENKLLSKAVFNKEVKDSYKVKIKATDKGGLSVSGTFTITVTNVNEKPENLQLSAKEIAENEAVGTEIGLLSATDVDENDVVTITLDGDNDDNDQFEIKENKLISKVSFDFETKKIYTVKIKATDKDGLFITREFTISVTDQNEAPVSIKANKSSIAENSAVGTFVTEIIAIDNDKDDVTTLTIADNDNFELDNNRVITKKEFNYEDTDSYTITITATDKGGLKLEKEIDITVSNVNETPYNLSISNLTILEDVNIGTEVAKISADDADENDEVTYTIKDNKYFEINDNSLRTKADLSPLKSTDFTVHITATDKGGLTVTKEFAITVKENNSTSVNTDQNINLDIYPNPVSDIVNIKADKVIESIDILTVSGRIVYSKVVNYEQIRVNTNNIQSGVYIIRIRTENSTVTKKIIIRH